MLARRFIAAIGIVVLAGCDGRKPPPQHTPPTTMPAPKGPLRFELLATPKKLAMAERADFVIGIRATNTSSETVDVITNPAVFSSTLFVNGEESSIWMLASSNGAMAADETVLTPNRSFELVRKLGESLFERPGKYHLVMKTGDHEHVADVEVTP